MPEAGLRDRLIIFERGTSVTNTYGQESGTAWVEYTRAYARVRFGTAQEKRQAAQEAAVQTATFECEPTPKLRGVTERDRILFEGQAWDINGMPEHLGRSDIRFTGVRSR